MDVPAEIAATNVPSILGFNATEAYALRETTTALIGRYAKINVHENEPVEAGAKVDGVGVAVESEADASKKGTSKKGKKKKSVRTEEKVKKKKR